MERILAAIFLGTALLWQPAQGQNDYPAGTFELTPLTNLELQPVEVGVPAQFADQIPAGAVLNLPPGFSVRVFAVTGGSGRPRMMAFDEQGVLHVAHVNRVLALPDRDDDGVADVEIVTVSGFEWVNSIAFHEGYMYVGETDKILRYRDGDGDLIYEEEEVLVADLPSEGWHTSRTIVIDEENQKLYVALGSPCDLCRLEQPVLGYSDTPLSPSQEWDAILEFNLDGSGRRIFATGMRNAVGLDIHPVTNEIWATHNHFDLGGAHLPPEWIDVVRDGDFMGYPFAYGYQVWVDDKVENYQRIWPYTSADSAMVARMKRPAALVEAHQAPLGIFFYDHPLFPKEYRHAAFVALHGGMTSGNLSAVPGFKVVAIFSEPDGSQAQAGDFLTGFGPPHTSRVWGKPVGISADPRGRLYVSSDSGIPAIYRIEPTILQGSWQHQLPHSVPSGADLAVALTVRLDRFDPDGEPPVLTVDLSAFGASEATPLNRIGDGVYGLEETLPVALPNGEFEVVVWIRQQNDAGLHSLKFVHPITVQPAADAVIFADETAPNWRLEHGNLIAPDVAGRDLVHGGTNALALEATPGRLAGWSLEFWVDRPFLTDGYQSLRFAFHPGTLETGGKLQVGVNQRSVGNRQPTGRYTLNTEFGKLVNLLADDGDSGVGGFEVDLSQRQWQVVEIPLQILQPSGTIELIRFFGNAAGTFYLDDIRLLTAAEQVSAVVERVQEGQPARFALGQNQPNPFNSQTTIRFSLPAAATVELSVYNLAGQRLVELVKGPRAAGAYTVNWDGRDSEGRRLASGVYPYRLRAGDQVKERKLLLLK